MEIIETVATLRKARSRHARLGLVPTMGFLHEGHLSLVRRAKQECGVAAVSIFDKQAMMTYIGKLRGNRVIGTYAGGAWTAIVLR